MTSLELAILTLLATSENMTEEDFENALLVLCDEYGTDAVGHKLVSCGAAG